LICGNSDARVGAEGRQAWPSVLPELIRTFGHNSSQHPAEGQPSVPSLVREQRQVLVTSNDRRSTLFHDADYTSDAVISVPAIWYSIWYRYKEMAVAITASEARRALFPLIEQVNDDRAPIEITSKRGNAVLMSADDYAAWQETAYLFRSPANARRLLGAAEAAERGETAEHQLDRA
jgi:antitoxin YefM